MSQNLRILTVQILDSINVIEDYQELLVMALEELEKDTSHNLAVKRTLLLLNSYLEQSAPHFEELEELKRAREKLM